jgi:hypothetical protein
MEERRGEQYAKEVGNGILDIKKEMAEVKEREEEVHNHNHNNISNHNQPWSRPRDKNGRFMSSSAAPITTAVAASNTTTAVEITTTPATIATAKPPSSLPSWHNNKLRDSRSRFVASTAAASAT